MPMTANEYRAAILALGLSQVKAGEALEISERTSRRYARDGIPAYAINRIRRRLDRLADARKEDKK